jgi:hypothetical protein
LARGGEQRNAIFSELQLGIISQPTPCCPTVSRQLSDFVPQLQELRCGSAAAAAAAAAAVQRNSPL